MIGSDARREAENSKGRLGDDQTCVRVRVCRCVFVLVSVYTHPYTRTEGELLYRFGVSRCVCECGPEEKEADCFGDAGGCAACLCTSPSPFFFEKGKSLGK